MVCLPQLDCKFRGSRALSVSFLADSPVLRRVPDWHTKDTQFNKWKHRFGGAKCLTQGHTIIQVCQAMILALLPPVMLQVLLFCALVEVKNVSQD